MKNKAVVPALLLILGIVIEKYSHQIRESLSVGLYYVVECIMVLVPVVVVIFIRKVECYYHKNFFMVGMILIYMGASALILIGAFLKINHLIKDYWIARTGNYLMFANIFLLLYLIIYEIKCYFDRRLD